MAKVTLQLSSKHEIKKKLWHFKFNAIHYKINNFCHISPIAKGTKILMTSPLHSVYEEQQINSQCPSQVFIKELQSNIKYEQFRNKKQEMTKFNKISLFETKWANI